MLIIASQYSEEGLLEKETLHTYEKILEIILNIICNALQN